MIMKMEKILVLWPLLFFALFCSEQPTDPPPEQDVCEISDTTTHNFTWHTDTLGEWPSVLYDVAAVDENNVWAVGAINIGDDRFNAVKWDGVEFGYYSLLLEGYGGGNPTIQELRILLTFSENDIWVFSASGSYARWNGHEWESEYIGPFQKGITLDAWGSSSNDIFIVGSNGSITHYDGSSFTLMESGTDVELRDITGYVDSETGLTHAWAAGPLTLLHYDGYEWQTVWDENNPLVPDGYNHPAAIHAINHKQLLVAAYKPIEIRGYCINTKDPADFRHTFTTDFFPYAIAGATLSDIFVVGSMGNIAHFNGADIIKYPESNSNSNRNVSYVNDHVFVVGPLAEQLGLFVRGGKIP